MTIPQQLADLNHTLFSRMDDSARCGEHPVAIETRDHGVIRSWADCHGLTPSAPTTCPHDHDGGAAWQPRFTTEAEASARPGTWADWLTRFDALGLSFVFEATMSTLRLARPLAARGTGANGDAGSSPLHVEAASTGRFRVKRARVGF